MSVDVKALRELLVMAAPPPWRVMRNKGSQCADDICRDLPEGDHYAEAVWLPEHLFVGDTAGNEANAALIVAAVNNLEPLLDGWELMGEMYVMLGNGSYATQLKEVIQLRDRYRALTKGGTNG